MNRLAPLCRFLKLPFFLLLLTASHTVAAHDTDDGTRQLGSVNFPISCSETAIKHTNHGLALLHHMTYEDARAAFAAATAEDPECAMGYWGESMTYIHPLWSDPPTSDEYSAALALLSKARSKGRKTDWESAYIGALEAYFSYPWSQNEAPRLERYAKAWEKVYRQYPDDIEAASFYALAYLSTADPKDKTYSVQKESGRLASGILDRVADHPGGHHYTIHAYDYPPLASRALAVARNYGRIAPAIPHALHMPTHIFTREGMWQESIDWNIRSADAALNKPVSGAISLHYLHALDYLAYAYLQTARDDKAREVLATIEAIDSAIQPHIATAYTLAAVPARLALEIQQWVAAENIAPGSPASYPWQNYPAMEAITYFSRALGAARNNHQEQAQAAIAKLDELKKQLPASAGYWATQVEIQRLSALAWLHYIDDKDKALETMNQAAELESSTEKHPVTPGEILPANELLADMLLELGQYQTALSKYKTTLARSPNRLNSLYGAGYASEHLGDAAQARVYYQQLLEQTSNTDTPLAGLQHARHYLDNTGS